MDYYADISVTIMLYILLGISLNLLVGFTGQISLAHGALYGIGAYTAGLLMVRLSWPLPPALLAAAAMTFVCASVVSVPALRIVGEYLILLTLAFNQVVQQLMVSLISFTGGLDGLSGVPPLRLFGSDLTTPTSVFGPLLAVTVIVALLAWRIGESPFGRVLKGIREDEIAVRSLGKFTPSYKLLAFAVSAGIAGFAGALSASYYQFIAPGSYTLDLSIFVIAIVILGGAGSILGSIVGAFVLGLLPPLLQHTGLTADNTIVWQSVIYGLALVVFMRFRPSGIAPEGARVFRRLKTALLRSVAETSGTPPTSADALYVLPRRVGIASEDEREEMIRIEGLEKSFGGIRAVRGVDLVLRRGRITALVGPNGAGKTTIFDLVTGLIRPDAGRVLLADTDITGDSLDRSAKRGLARSFQDVRVFRRLSVLDNVTLAVPGQPGESIIALVLRPLATRRGETEARARARSYLAFVGLERQADEMVGNLSFAEQKLVALARLLATECEVLLLDEPTSGLDPVAVDRMIDIVVRLRDVGRTVCIVEHSLHVVEQLADHVYFLEDGQVTAEGGIGDLMRQSRLVEAYFGT